MAGVRARATYQKDQWKTGERPGPVHERHSRTNKLVKPPKVSQLKPKTLQLPVIVLYSYTLWSHLTINNDDMGWKARWYNYQSFIYTHTPICVYIDQCADLNVLCGVWLLHGAMMKRYREWTVTSGCIKEQLWLFQLTDHYQQHSRVNLYSLNTWVLDGECTRCWLFFLMLTD